MRRATLFLFPVIALALFPATQAEAGHPYGYQDWFRLQGGLAFTHGGDFRNTERMLNETLDGTSMQLPETNYGLNFAAAWDRHVTSILGLGLEAQFDRISSSDEGIEQGVSVSMGQTGTAWSLLTNVTVMPLESRFLYWGAGGGITYAGCTWRNEISGSSAEVVSSNWAPTAQLYLGVSVPVSPRGYIGVHASYRFRRVTLDEGTLRLDGRDYQTLGGGDGGDDVKLDFSGPVVTVMLGGYF